MPEPKKKTIRLGIAGGAAVARVTIGRPATAAPRPSVCRKLRRDETITYLP
jgi:hypothetical protein